MIQRTSRLATFENFFIHPLTLTFPVEHLNTVMFLQHHYDFLWAHTNEIIKNLGEERYEHTVEAITDLTIKRDDYFFFCGLKVVIMHVNLNVVHLNAWICYFSIVLQTLMTKNDVFCKQGMFELLSYFPSVGRHSGLRCVHFCPFRMNSYTNLILISTTNTSSAYKIKS